ncbi:hypothetical protein C4D60_Mb03t02290 [Musa balbisiana]|uniref:Uncharacterized protein n=1 Tax=Musa balbisiana TaxID=52838 RepID=A0A4S8J9E3_MUSBA|nr:hypothetical protein C4D60_Mb03t02290 [Musa balbisiana]
MKAVPRRTGCGKDPTCDRRREWPDEVVVGESEISELREHRDLLGYGSLELVEAEIQEDELGSSRDGGGDAAMEAVAVEIEVGRAEKPRSRRVPLRPEEGKRSCTRLPAASQRTPNQLHGVVALVSDHELSVSGWNKLVFQFTRASAAVAAPVSAVQVGRRKRKKGRNWFGFMASDRERDEAEEVYGSDCRWS